MKPLITYAVVKHEVKLGQDPESIMAVARTWCDKRITHALLANSKEDLPPCPDCKKAKES